MFTIHVIYFFICVDKCTSIQADTFKSELNYCSIITIYKDVTTLSKGQGKKTKNSKGQNSGFRPFLAGNRAESYC